MSRIKAVSIILTILLSIIFIPISLINSIFYSQVVIGLSLFFFFIFAYNILLKNDKVELKLDIVNQENKALIAALKENQIQYDAIFDSANLGIALLRLDGDFIRVNEALCQLLGFSKDELLKMNFYFFIHPNEQDNLQAHIKQVKEKVVKSYQCEQKCIKKNGDEIWIGITVTLMMDNDDQAIGFITQIQNITLQKKAEERLRHLAYHDPLTGLANRNKLEQFMTHIIASSRRYQHNFALLFLDLDRFKNINDTLGHDAGDLLLRVVSERLRSVVRASDMVVRLGGDEFIVFITEITQTDTVAIIAQKILATILQPIILKGQEVYITTSIGISMFPYDGQNIEMLLKNADLAAYRAKEQGRNNYQFYQVEMTTSAKEKMKLQNALAHALSKNEFILHYQPQMEMNTRAVKGVEVLLRWKNKEFTSISPHEIIKLAEETGLIIPVSEWILRTSLKQLKEWHSAGFNALSLAVNCSARQFKQSNLAEDILALTKKMNLDPSFLEIEITESIIMQDPENMLQMLRQLKQIGVKIVIDDFGTGYWSLGNLKKLSVDKVKIDKSFIRLLPEDENSRAISSIIIDMCKRLEIISVAEGVETREQYEFLAEEGCAQIQGFYLTQPIPFEEMTKFLKHPVPDAEVINKFEITE